MPDDAKITRLNDIVHEADMHLNFAAEAVHQLAPTQADQAVESLARLVEKIAGTVLKLAVELRDTRPGPAVSPFNTQVRR